MDKGVDKGLIRRGTQEAGWAPDPRGGLELADPSAPGYGLHWPGKAAMLRRLKQPVGGVLHADRKGSRGFDAGGNLLIEGDNLAVLMRLRGAYGGKVKMIYIDPPYNTGRHFQYRDNYRGTRDAADPGWRHGDWLEMIYPRLVLAREMLRTDGVLFVSIDDNEVHTLRLILDEIFGEDNFVAMFPWQSRTSRQNDTDLSVQHEYVLAYARRRRREQRRLKASNAGLWHRLEGFAFRPAPVRADRYANPDDDPRGPWKADPFDAPNVRPNLTYPIVNPNTGEAFLPPPGRCWRTGPERFRELLEDGRIRFGRNGRARPQLKVFLHEKSAYGEVAATWLDGATCGTANTGTRELRKLFDGRPPFSFPKPTSLVRFLLRLSTGPDDLVMDFFAGSGVTGHATLAQNREDGGRRRFLLVQRAEALPGASWPDIAEITRERLRRAIDRLGYDAGFRAFRLVQGGSGETLWNRLAEAGLPLHTPLEKVGPALYRMRQPDRDWLLCAAARLPPEVGDRCRALGVEVLACPRDACDDEAGWRSRLAAAGVRLKLL